ncbi:MAG: hypothetical protein J6L62_06745 [Clostridia bacterium]|nr:hypothetical protein [Clostridia bacterium]
MANCPKCGKKLGITNIKPTCPNCGVNLLYYKIEERLEVDAINAELEHAKTQKRIDRLKNATIGSPLSIVRLVLILLVVGTLFLPLATLHTVGPFFDESVTFNALEIYNKVSAMDFDGLFGILGSPLLGKAFIFLLVSAVTIVLAALCALLSLVLSILSSSPKGFIRNVILASLGIISTVASIVCYNMFISNITPILPGLVEGGVSWGAYCVIAAFVILLGINVVIKFKQKPVKYKQCYIDSVPYEVFVEKFGIKKYDLAAVEEIKAEFDKLKDEYDAKKEKTA